MCLEDGGCSSDICCGVTTKVDGSSDTTGQKICVPSKGDGTVPNGLPFGGYKYSCPKPTPVTPVVASNYDVCLKDSGCSSTICCDVTKTVDGSDASG